MKNGSVGNHFNNDNKNTSNSKYYYRLIPEIKAPVEKQKYGVLETIRLRQEKSSTFKYQRESLNLTSVTFDICAIFLKSD
uniref:Uncharacterized protein n=1 Tax=Onchocerca volvulus TaxID=6282 RepID=A0A8R1TUY1_ONCVO